MDIPEIATFAAALLAVLALIMAIAWVLRRFFGGAERTSRAPALRRRNRRLGVIEGVQIGNRHRLLLVRRDDTEHLLLIGGATELVVESGIPHPESEADVNIRSAEPRFGAGGPTLQDSEPSYAGGGDPAGGRGFGSFPRPDFGALRSRHDPGDDLESRSGYGRDDTGDYPPRQPPFGGSDHDEDDRPSYLGGSRPPFGRDEEPPGRSFGPRGQGRDHEDDPERGDSRYERGSHEEEDEQTDAPGDAHSRILSRFLKRDGD